ncbi:MAG: sodium:alanine symporter family protein [Bdellovibrionota bacterium]|nr:MAG: sodium:alanine symporter family protein [Bdellovibrionota bacterium]
MNAWLEAAVGYVWGLPLVVALALTGLYVSLRMTGFRNFVQIWGFRHALDVVRGKYTHPDDPGQLSHFQALCTALSATVGLGNIAGVAVAIHLGGPGATFWMILTGLIGMATKFTECSLAVKYRRIDEKGVVHGGPMYYIERGLGQAWKPLAVFFAFAVIMGSFGGANMFQANQVASIMFDHFGIPKLATGIILGVATGLVIVGGIKRIGTVTGKLVPFMAAIYIGGALLILAMHIDLLPVLLWQIVHDAFTGTAAVGGFAGIAVQQGIIQGVRRASFSNEAGMGSAPIAHATATTKEPIREGVVALLEPFIDTVVICTMTALVILISGVWTEGSTGVKLSADAFNHGIPGFGTWFIPIAVFLFAYSTLISWSYYGERGVDYLFGERYLMPYRILFCLVTVLGSVWTLDAVINFSDLMIGLMIIPNLIAIWLLSGEIAKDSQSYFARLRNGEFERYK